MIARQNDYESTSAHSEATTIPVTHTLTHPLSRL